MIASVGPVLPLPLLRATGRYRGPLAWNVDRAMPFADRWLETKFPPWAFSILEDWAAGKFDNLEAVVFSRAEDAAQRLYYYVCELQRRGIIGGPQPLICDVSLIPRPESMAHLEAALARLAEILGIGDDALIRALGNAGTDTPPSDAGTGALCLLAGTPPPDRRLHDAATQAGWRMHGPTLAESWSEMAPVTLEPDESPFTALARAMRGTAAGNRDFRDRKAALAREIRQTGASAAVLWFTEDDEARIWDLPGQLRVLDEMGVPALALTRRDWAARDGAGSEIRQFLKELSA
ncbi:hypothetical protein KNJ79_13815 [Sphingopyxis indica]|uniref:hypothetical protein n=1 Tax=Sphingopyxis indica TaxID=436663 RepID=UPI0029390F2E|nr:hypothetical protein [Sphingopyxis indica]WOF42274.1 hypothetical protein KNJ79_13815 [Sphingopyxis indica]